MGPSITELVAKVERDGNKLRFASGPQTVFKYPISDAIEVGVGVAVLLAIPENVVLSENVYAVNPDGEFVWQIGKRSHTKPCSSFVRLDLVDGVLLAFYLDEGIVAKELIWEVQIVEEGLDGLPVSCTSSRN